MTESKRSNGVRKFRAGEAVVEAVEVADVLADLDRRLRGGSSTLPDWLRGAMREGALALHGEGIRVRTRVADAFGGAGDWIVRGTGGEIDVVKPDVLAAYDLVDEA
jgi:hypothetical protein